MGTHGGSDGGCGCLFDRLCELAVCLTVWRLESIFSPHTYHPALSVALHPFFLQLASVRSTAQKQQQQLTDQAADLTGQLKEARREAAAAHHLAEAERERVDALEQARNAAAQVCSTGRLPEPGFHAMHALRGQAGITRMCSPFALLLCWLAARAMLLAAKPSFPLTMFFESCVHALTPLRTRLQSDCLPYCISHALLTTQLCIQLSSACCCAACSCILSFNSFLGFRV